jgi:hypothetical protein
MFEDVERIRWCREIRCRCSAAACPGVAVVALHLNRRLRSQVIHDLNEDWKELGVHVASACSSETGAVRRTPTFDESSVDANDHLAGRFIRFSILGNFPLNLFVDALPLPRGPDYSSPMLWVAQVSLGGTRILL